MSRIEPEVERLLADRETPFTDFYVEELEGSPRAVFPKLPPEQSSLLSRFLYPSRTYIDAIYQDALKLKNSEAHEITYEDEDFKASFGTKSLVIVAKQPASPNCAPAIIKLPAIDARYLLLKWKYQCMRWESIKSAAK
jgi:hypothetical protein